ncbi:Cytochrome ubiquinol oxidase subunit 2 [Rickettsiales endosymbiont of Paramecium tredecaurelia]|uniref:cytochrome d ubiquinol oxidase subunit II n=1 Tax=Candidatus Sarmatiella mevalonica TaxID=2770581 RepID=UPI001921939F|nr:cytochrome d ubiquinol oxidase subunit II [Candidatus Sarmatiella mevalonica]MBL3284846.1 Cytochrome ubiquinol oxidase subunit 2 [Candidatus Sarmatiella mevalonica]
MLSLTILQIIWWLLLGILLCGFSILGGMDLGVASLLPFIAKNDVERRVVINSIAPTWEGNQVWFILGGGAIFAAWPLVYAVVFSSCYYALFLILLALILRPVGFDFRSKIEHHRWRNTWDYLLCFSGILATVCFGLAIGNLYIGLDFHFDELMHITYSKVHFFDLFTPLPLLCAGISMCAFLSQGAMFLSLKTQEEIKIRALNIAHITPIIAAILFLCAGFLLLTINGFTYQLNQRQEWSVQVYQGGWFTNYMNHPILFILPILALLACCVTAFLAKKQINKPLAKLPHDGQMLGVYEAQSHNVHKVREDSRIDSDAQLPSGVEFGGVCNKLIRIFFVLSSSSITPLFLATFGASFFPFITPCKTHEQMSLLAWNSSSSQYSLFVMLIAVIVFLPIVLFYTSWAYKLMFGRVKKEEIENDTTHQFY